MATKQIKDYSAKTALDSTDQFLIQESGDTTKKTTTAELGILDGWIPVAETWTYASADDPTYTFTITGNVTTKYSVGMKLRLTQTTVKYFIITAISYSDPSTTVTVYGGTTYDLADAAITLPYYSMVKAPYGFPMSPTKWTETTLETTDRYVTNPTASTYYGGATAWTSGDNIVVSVPTGAWEIQLKMGLSADKSGASARISAGLATTDSGSLSIFMETTGYSSILVHAGVVQTHIVSVKTPFYVLAYTGISSQSEIRITYFRCNLVCAYL